MPPPPQTLPQSSVQQSSFYSLSSVGNSRSRRVAPKSQNRPDLKKVLKERCLKRSTLSPLGNPLSRENLFSPIGGGGGGGKGGEGSLSSDATGGVASAKELLDEELRIGGGGGMKRRIDMMMEEGDVDVDERDERGERDEEDDGYDVKRASMSQSESRAQEREAPTRDYGDGWGDDEWGDGFKAVSEEEYAQLLEEIEREMREDEEIMLREYEENFASAEYEYVEQLGGEFNEGGGGEVGEAVLCPICESCDLVQTSADVILCRKRDCLRIDLINEGIDLKYLKENLANIFFQHAAGCPEKLKVIKDDQFGIVVLMAQCEACGEEYCVL
ncbi:hypothetical protein TrST_g6865 [Triparma strigata]|uniref:RPA-interacting protein C-terminal domain-containing protein n=1 Tax=Triparma strigata TaxID=1606541 RepID=A0A9W7BPF1_9STRA|nr:hypothetical protein TrST_g6865 [Triparma strigata]